MREVEDALEPGERVLWQGRPAGLPATSILVVAIAAGVLSGLPMAPFVGGSSSLLVSASVSPS